MIPKIPPARLTSSTWWEELGATLHKLGTLRESASISFMVKSTPASWAMANRCSTVLVEPPMAISSDMALKKAARLAMERGNTRASPFSYQAWHISTMRSAAASNRSSLAAWVATTVPLPGRARPRASLRQFMELAVNMPEQEPQVGQALRSTSARSTSLTWSSAAMTMASIKSSERPKARPASMGPPDTNIAGIFKRMAAMSIPGVILSQLEIHTMASTVWALHMYSTESAISSRDGRE